jgi:N4-gp56 family major capsid protein
MGALLESNVVYDGSTDAISYDGIVEAIDLFQEEDNVEKVMFIHPTQVSELRKDSDFIAKDKYGNEVMVNGEIGMVANARIVPSKRVPYANGAFTCPIVELRPQEQTGDELSAVTIFLKRNVNVETERDLKNYTTLIGADEHYVVGLTDESKVVLAKFKANVIPSL